MNKQGFTLVEITIVVIIISLLTLLIIPNLLRARNEANHTYAKATLNTIAKALENYSNINTVYPTGEEELLDAEPQYMHTNYMDGVYNGYSFELETTDYTYTIKATPEENKGQKIFFLKTGMILIEENL